MSYEEKRAAAVVAAQNEAGMLRRKSEILSARIAELTDAAAELRASNEIMMNQNKALVTELQRLRDLLKSKEASADDSEIADAEEKGEV